MRWRRLPWSLVAITAIGLGAGIFQAFHFSDLPEALPRLIAAEAVVAVAFGLVLAIALHGDHLQRRLEAKMLRFRDIAASTGDRFWETGPDLRFTYLSANFTEATGQNPALVLGRNSAELRIGDGMPEHWRRQLCGLDNPRPFRDYVHSAPLPSRDPFVFKSSGVPVFDKDGRFQGYRGVTNDITAATLAERKARQLETDLVHVQRMEALGAFAGGIAHDVNNALLPILAMIRSLMRRPSDRSREQESLTLALEAAQRCRDLVSDQLALIRRELADDVAIDLKGPVADAVAIVQRSLPRAVRLAIEIEPVPMPVISAPIKVVQIVAHLVSNAVQAVGERATGGEVALRVAASTDLDGYLIEVTDDGPGIPDELRSKIFEPFFTTRSTSAGTGLGLSTVLSLTCGLGGKVSLASRPGEGARFIVFLPRATAEAMEANLADARESQQFY